MPLLGPNVKALKLFGMLEAENGVRRVVYSTTYYSLLLFSILEWTKVCLMRANVEIFLHSLLFALVTFITSFKLRTMVRSQNQWRQIIQYVTETDILSRNKDEVSQKIVDSYTKYSQKLSYIYWATQYGITFVMLLQVPLPLVNYYSSESYRESVKNASVEMEHVIGFWVPLDMYHNLVGFTVVAILEGYISIYSCGIITSYDAIVIVIMVFIRGELEMLRGVGSKMFDDDDEMAKLIEFKRRQSNLIKYTDMFNRCISPVMFVYLLISSISILCTCIYQITAEPVLVQKIVKLIYPVFELTQLFLYCWHGNRVTFQSGDPKLGIYESAWWRKPIYRKELIILMMQSDKNISFKAGPSFTLTTDTFVAILKGAYSYHTISSNYSR